MPLELHNTLSGKREAFRPGNPDEVTFYTCGPTVYDYAHIGNFRAFLVADVLRRWIESPLCEVIGPDGEPRKGPRRVVHVMNMTDVGHMTDDADDGEDRMAVAAERLTAAKKSGKLPPGAPADFDPANPYHIARFYGGAFLEDAKMLGLKVVFDAEKDPSLMPRPTEKVAQMLAMILELLRNGHAYIGAGGVVYYDTQSFPEYGKLSGNTLDALRAGAGGRVAAANQAAKRHPADFMLWKPDPRHLMRWDPKKVLNDPSCPLLEGYPGWHIECSAMARERLGDVIDLHSGGEDNIFPHHECEIAQSCGATGEKVFARHWVHVRHLFVEGEKMSKSKGNFYTVRDLVAKGFDPAAIRLELIKTHYRTNANFTEQGLRDSQRMVERWRRFLAECEGADGGVEGDARGAFAAAMHDDLNVAGAVGVINAWINGAKPSRVAGALLRRLDDPLGVLALSPAAGDGAAPADPRADELRLARDAARKAKNWAESDRLRDELIAMGYEVADSKEGTRIKRKASL